MFAIRYETKMGFQVHIIIYIYYYLQIMAYTNIDHNDKLLLADRTTEKHTEFVISIPN